MKKNRKRKKQIKSVKAGVAELVKSSVIPLVVLAILLAVVWKQVYITQVSVRRSVLVDSLTVVETNVKELELKAAELSANSRIEKIAREKLQLEHTPVDQISFIPGPVRSSQAAVYANTLASLFKKFPFSPRS